MSHPIQNMPAGYKVEEVRKFSLKDFDSVMVYNYPAQALVINSFVPSDIEETLRCGYTTAVFRIKWKN